MPDETFGYEPFALPGYAAHYDDYVGGQYLEYTPTPWDDFGEVNIDKMWTWIQNESDERARGVSEMWRRLSMLLEATHADLLRYGQALQTSWTGDAAKEFLRRVGAALYSLDEWRKAATDNQRAVNDIADKIETTQTTMRGIWQRYTVAAAEAEARREDEATDNALMHVARGFSEDPDTHEEVQRRFTNEAKPVMRGLADLYMDSTITMDRGTMFKGPTEANTSVMAPPNPFGGGGPGPAIPTMPSMPTLPPLPPLPGPPPPLPLPPGPAPEHAGILPTPPVLPTPPTMPTPPGGPPPPPAMPVLPVLPGLPVPPGGGPARPGTPTPPGSGRLQPGAGQPPGTRQPGMPGARPNLPGTSGRSGAPGRAMPPPPPGMPRRPSLRGVSPRGEAPVRPSLPGVGIPAEPGPTAPPRLDGRRGPRPAAPATGNPPAIGRPGPGGVPGTGNVPPNLAGRRKPDGTGGTGAPGGGTKATPPGTRRMGVRGPRPLGGRSLPGGGGAIPGAPLGPQLGGSRSAGARAGERGGAIPPTTRRGPARGEHKERNDRVSDEDLFTVAPVTAAVEPPPPEPPVEPGRALGRAQ